MTLETRQNVWSMLNTALLTLITITGFFVIRWMNEIDDKFKGVVADVSAINVEIRAIKSDREYEKGRLAGIREALEAQRRREEDKQK